MELLRPFLEGKDLKRWHVEPRDIWLIFTRRGVDIEQYPAILKYLEQFKERLQPKPKNWAVNKFWPGRKPGSYKWYEIQDSIAYYEEFEKPKLVYPEISQGNKFYMDKSCSYTNKTVFVLPTADYFLLGILNSTTIWFYLTGTCAALRGGVWRLLLQSIYVNEIPIPPATPAQQQALATLAEQCQQLATTRYQKQQAVRQRIPDLAPLGTTVKLNTKLHNWWQLDFGQFRHEVKKCFTNDIPLAERNAWEQWLTQERQAVTHLSTQLTAAEQQLNERVYELFALTDQEIKLIEVNTNSSFLKIQ